MKFKLYLFLILSLLFSSINTFAINPSRDYVITPDSLKIPHTQQFINSTSNTQLNSWSFIHSDASKPLIIISYGDSGNMSGVLFQARALFEAGYNVVTYDYRGFGKSSDFNMNKDQLYYNEFKQDLSAVIRYSKHAYHPQKIYLFGLSMGSMISMLVSEKEKVDGLILDSFVTNPFAIKDRVEKMKNRQLVLPKGAAEFSKKSKQSKLPILIFQGAEDLFTTVKDAEEYKLANSNAKIISCDCNHLQSFYKMTKQTLGDLYVQEIAAFTNLK
ncbi:MAG TPA: alpha/beta fold hydrolase [Daejeonella sp.]|nr:alpha/beta fold hydrolase [Daejeonella sp.]